MHGCLLQSSGVDANAITSRLDNHEARLGQVEKDTAQAKRGVAAAIALTGGAMVPAGKRVAVSANWGTFGGEHAFGTNTAILVTDGVYLNGGIGVTSNEVGGRAGLTLAW